MLRAWCYIANLLLWTVMKTAITLYASNGTHIQSLYQRKVSCCVGYIFLLCCLMILYICLVATWIMNHTWTEVNSAHDNVANEVIWVDNSLQHNVANWPRVQTASYQPQQCELITVDMNGKWMYKQYLMKEAVCNPPMTAASTGLIFSGFKSHV